MAMPSEDIANWGPLIQALLHISTKDKALSSLACPKSDGYKLNTPKNPGIRLCTLAEVENAYRKAQLH